MHRFAHTEAYQTLMLEDYHANRDDPIQIQLSLNENNTALVLNILNRSEDDGELELDLSTFDVVSGEANGVLLSADDLLSMNRLDDQQITERAAAVTVTDKTVKTAVQKLSFAEYILPLNHEPERRMHHDLLPRL